MVRINRKKRQHQEDTIEDSINQNMSENPDIVKQSNVELLKNYFIDERYLDGYLKVPNEYFDDHLFKKWKPVKISLFFLICRIIIGFNRKKWKYGSFKDIATILNAQPEDVSFYLWELEQEKFITCSKEKVISLNFEFPKKKFTAIPYRIVKSIVLRELSKPQIVILLFIIRRTIGDKKNLNFCIKYKTKTNMTKGMGYSSMKVTGDAIDFLNNKRFISLGKNRYNKRGMPIYIYFTPETFIPTNDKFFQFLSKRYPSRSTSRSEIDKISIQTRSTNRSDYNPHFDQSKSVSRSVAKEANESIESTGYKPKVDSPKDNIIKDTNSLKKNNICSFSNPTDSSKRTKSISSASTGSNTKDKIEDSSEREEVFKAWEKMYYLKYKKTQHVSRALKANITVANKVISLCKKRGKGANFKFLDLTPEKFIQFAFNFFYALNQSNGCERVYFNCLGSKVLPKLLTHCHEWIAPEKFKVVQAPRQEQVAHNRRQFNAMWEQALPNFDGHVDKEKFYYQLVDFGALDNIPYKEVYP